MTFLEPVMIFSKSTFRIDMNMPWLHIPDREQGLAFQFQQNCTFFLALVFVPLGAANFRRFLGTRLPD